MIRHRRLRYHHRVGRSAAPSLGQTSPFCCSTSALELLTFSDRPTSRADLLGNGIRSTFPALQPCSRPIDAQDPRLRSLHRRHDRRVFHRSLYRERDKPRFWLRVRHWWFCDCCHVLAKRAHRQTRPPVIIAAAACSACGPSTPEVAADLPAERLRPAGQT